MISAGDYNRRVIFEERVLSASAAAEDPPALPLDPLAADPLLAPGGDPLGDPHIWTARFERWMQLKPLALQEAEQGAALVGSGRWIGEALLDPDTEAVRPETWRLRAGELVFNLRGVADPDGRRRRLSFTLEEGVAT
ncbi:head-tail adaptor protein [Neomegalonema perideroedes]|uniref:phage head completion protein n=1 Tax=Neomegalonema perideroedes TaxID=217219 RepID=UPI00036A1311|nr:hypothetical protein [Neomegalonema perideroedes]